MKRRHTIMEMLVGALAVIGVSFAAAYGVARATAPTSLAGAQIAVGNALGPVDELEGCQLTCGNTATTITCSLTGVRRIVITNTSDTDIYVGGAEVTNSAGYLLKVGSTLNLAQDQGSSTTLSLKCAVSGGGKALSVLEGK